MLVFTLLLSLLSLPISANFANLTNVVQYAHDHEEFPKANSDNWNNPDYTSFHQKQVPNFFYKKLMSWGYSFSSIWNPYEFKALLKKITVQQREALRSEHNALNLRLKPGTRLFVWSDLYGAFHSLTRCLMHLKEQGIIDEQLKILNDQDMFIFNGNFINRSPHSLKALTLMLRLLEQNPQQVIYIQGEQEQENYWKNFNLKDELIIRARYASDEKIPFGKELSTFFATLSPVAYISITERPSEVMRISYVSSYQASFDEYMMDDFFAPHNKTITMHNLKNRKPTADPLDVQVILKTKNWLEEMRGLGGLELYDQDKGATTWSLLSSPIPLHRQYLNFHYDAFAIITLGKSLSTSSIALYNQDALIKKGFTKAAEYNLVTGQAFNPAQKALKPFDIGSSITFAGRRPFLGQQLKSGISLAVNEINKAGGINGEYLRVFLLDDDYNPQLTLKNISLLVDRYKTNLILAPRGTPTTKAYIDQVRDKKVYVFFPATGAPEFRTKDLSAMIHLRASYADEARALINYMLKTHKSKKFAFFYQDDSYGIGPLKAAHEELKKHNITTWVDTPYTRSEVNFQEQAEKIIKAQVDVIVFFAQVFPSQELIRQIGIETLANKKLCIISPINIAPMHNFIEEYGLEAIMSSVVPNPYTSNLQIVQDYRAAADAIKLPYDVYSLEAYIATKLLGQALRSIKPPFSNEKIMTYFESLKNYNFEGLPLNFNPETRTLLHKVWVGLGTKSSWVEEDIPSEKTGLW